MSTEQTTLGLRKNRRAENKKKIKHKIFHRFLCTFLVIVSLLIVIAAASIMGLRLGVAPGIQEYLVTSSMRTLNHKYIAHIIASPETIKDIMQSNRVEEKYDKQNTSLIIQNEALEKLNKIELINISRDGYTGYLLKITNPERVFLSPADQLGVKGTKIIPLAQEYNAIAGINAGGFVDAGGHGMGAQATGILITNSKINYYDPKVNKYNIIGFNKKNILILGSYTLAEVQALNLRAAVDFHPFLIVNGKPTKVYGNGGWGSGPRTAIGQMSDGTVLMVVIDGRQLSSRGASMKQLQDIMISYGAINAANLDGGSSTVMYYQNKIVNSPCSPYGDRFLPSAFLVSAPSTTK